MCEFLQLILTWISTKSSVIHSRLSQISWWNIRRFTFWVCFLRDCSENRSWFHTRVLSEFSSSVTLLSTDQLIGICASPSCLKELHASFGFSSCFWAWSWMLGKHLQMDIIWKKNRQTKKTPLHWNAHTKQTPNVTHHSRIPWQWLIYLSCSWHMPQLESNFPQTSLFGPLLYFLAFQSGPAPTMLRIRCIIAASGGFLITKHSIPVSRRME